MITTDEITRSFRGAYLLLRGRREGMREFDTSLSGFWRSFQVILLLIPFYLLLFSVERKLYLTQSAFSNETFPEGRFFVSGVLTIGIDWIAYPAILAILARPLGFARAYAPYIVAYNWSMIFVAIILLPPYLMYSFGVVSVDALLLLQLMCTIFVLRYQYTVARIATLTTMGVAIGLVAFNFVLSLVIELFIGHTIGI